MTHIIGTTGNDRDDTALHGSDDDDLIEGLAGYDDLYGAGGNDTLDGETGVDRMYGGAGNDTYYVDNKHDTAVELHGEGRDTVYSSVAYTIGDNIEKLILTGIGNTSATGNSDNNILIGNSGNNRLNGGAGADALGGGLGNDTLDGGKGGDVMKGGAGDDRYYIDNKLDVVTEYAGQGSDTVYINGTYTLGLNIENLTLSGSGDRFGTGNALDNIITGNAGNNTLGGADGNDVINGGKGADTMRGGMGDDVFYVDNAGDTVTEYSSQGTDSVFSSVRFALGNNLENLTLTGVGNIAGTGNELDNSLSGNAGDNVLEGGLGNDLIDGGAGFDFASYGGSTVGVRVDLRIAGAQNTHGAGQDTLTSIEGLTGSDFADILNGGDRTPDGTTLVSANASILTSGGMVSNARLAPDGGSALFSTSVKLVAGDPTVQSYVYVYVRDLTGGDLVSVATDSAGQAMAGYAVDASYGSSHQVIFSFHGDSAGDSGVYSKDLATRELKQLMSGGAYDVTLSSDGTKLYFLTSASHSSHDTNGAADLYVRDLTTGAYRLVSADASGQAHTGFQLTSPESYTVSSDGSYVAFYSTATGLADGDHTGTPNIFLKNMVTGDIKVIAPGGQVSPVSALYYYSRAPLFSPDGTKLLFVSDSPNLDPDHPGNIMRAYVLDVASGAITDVSGDFIGGLDSAVWAGDSNHVGLIGRTSGNENVNAADSSDIVVKDLTTGQYHPVTFDIGRYDYISPFHGGVSFSADGRYVIYGDTQVYVHDNTIPATQYHGDDVLNGGAGNDKLYGNGGDDRLYGGAGNDRLDGGVGRDQLFGGAGNDTYVLTPTYSVDGPINDTIVEAAGEGIDTVLAETSYTLSDNVENLILAPGLYTNYNGTGNELNNVLTGSDGTNVLKGLAGDDTLYGLGGNDTLDGGAGKDILIGGQGNDSYLVHDLGDTIVEGPGYAEGYDTVTSIVDFTLSDNIENLILLDSDPDVPGAAAPIHGTTGNTGGNITGNAADNILTGYAGNDILSGNDGNDVLTGGGGDDTLSGNRGNDELHGGAGVDTLDGGDGNDTLTDNGTDAPRVGAVNDYLLGGAGDDSLLSYGNDDYLNGGIGNDHLEVQAGASQLWGDEGNDTLIGGTGNDYLYTGNGDDTAHGSGGDDYIEGYSGADTLDGGDGNDHIINTALGDGLDTITGGAGNDLIELFGDHNTVDGGDGMDEIHSSGGNCSLAGGAGSDFITAESGVNTVSGGASDDIIYGGTGNDTLTGDDGNDLIWGGGGQDVVDGGAGDDAYILTANSGRAGGVDSGGNDYILLGPNIDISDLLITTVGALTYYGLKDSGSANTDASKAQNYVSFATGSIEGQKVWTDVFTPNAAAQDDGADSAKAIVHETAHTTIMSTTWDYVQAHDWLFG